MKRTPCNFRRWQLSGNTSSIRWPLTVKEASDLQIPRRRRLRSVFLLVSFTVRHRLRNHQCAFWDVLGLAPVRRLCVLLVSRQAITAVIIPKPQESTASCHKCANTCEHNSKTKETQTNKENNDNNRQTYWKQLSEARLQRETTNN